MTRHSFARRLQRGFSVVELMISITIGLLILVALSAMFVNISGSNNEMAKSNSQIENGRFAIQLLESDLVHAGFWGTFVPQFDDVNWGGTPGDTPSAPPDPCLAYSASNWTGDYLNALIGIPLQSSDAAPGTCTLTDKKASTDVLVVRHASTCVTGTSGCDTDVSGKMYFQSSLCTSAAAGQVQPAGNTALTIALAPAAPSNTTSASNNAYVGMTVRIVSGAGAGQSRTISAYNGATGVATVSASWSPLPDSTSTYAIAEDVLGTSGFTLHNRGADCSTAATADKRKFVSTMYYVRTWSNASGDGIPTLVRSSFDPGATVALSHQPAEALVEGVEGFAVEIGIDNKVTRCGLNTAVALGAAVTKVDPATCAANTDPVRNTLPTNRGDGNPDLYVRCTTASPCTADQLANAVAAKFYVLVRNTEATPGFTDTKTYCMASVQSDGTCPSVLGPFNDHYKRHLFANTVRLTTISGRRETSQ